MDLHYKQEITVGLLVLVGVLVFLGGTMWLKGSSFSTDSGIKVAFADVGALTRGSPVRVSGVTVGKVEELELEEAGRVVVTFTLSDQRVQPKIDATARIGSVGLAGQAIVNFHPGISTTPLPPGKVIQGTVDRGLMDIGSDLSGQAREALAGIQEVANKQLADDLHATMVALQRFIAVYSNTQQGPTAVATRTLESLERLSETMDSSLARANLAATLRKSDTLIANLTVTSAQLTATSARLDSVVQMIREGRGSLGKLMTDSLLYADIRRLAQSLQAFTDTLRKTPGKIPIQIRIF